MPVATFIGAKILARWSEKLLKAEHLHHDEVGKLKTELAKLKYESTDDAAIKDGKI